MEETKKGRRNIWIIEFLVFFIMAIILSYVLFNQQETETEIWQDNICGDLPKYQIGTPSWFDNQGNLVFKGYLNLENITPEIFNTQFIDSEIYLVYRNGCSWCEKQIQDLEQIELWDEYKLKGFTIDCSQ